LCLHEDSSHWDALIKRAKRRNKDKDRKHPKAKKRDRTHKGKSNTSTEQPAGSDVTHVSESSLEGDSRPSGRTSGSKYPKGNAKDPAGIRGASSEGSPRSIPTKKVADFPAETDFNCVDDDGNIWHFSASKDVVTYDWNVPTEDPSVPNMGVKHFYDCHNFIQVIEYIGKIGYTFRKTKLQFPSADHLCYANMGYLAMASEEEGGVTVTPVPSRVKN
jgi:hypothetical protein